MMRAFSSLSAPVSLRSASASATDDEEAPFSEEQPAAASSNVASPAAAKRMRAPRSIAGTVVLIFAIAQDFDVRRIGHADGRPPARFDHSPHQHALSRQRIDFDA